MVDNQIRIREADPADISLLSDLIRLSYRDVADRFKLSVSNCPKHPSNYSNEWVEKDLGRRISYYILEHRGIAQDALRSKKPVPIFAISSAWLFYRMKGKKALAANWSNMFFVKHGNSEQKISASA